MATANPIGTIARGTEPRSRHRLTTAPRTVKRSLQGQGAVIDIHFHCLPGIDDGPSTWEEAVELCRTAKAEGTETIEATPHVMRDPWINEDRAERDRLLVRLNALLGGKPAVGPGCEMFFSSDVIELWESGNAGPLVGVNRGTAPLLEFPTFRV